MKNKYILLVVLSALSFYAEAKDQKVAKEEVEFKVSKKETIDENMQIFNLLDVNKNGFISKEELESIGVSIKDIDMFYADFSTEKYQEISKDVIFKKMNEDFDRVDKNKDGYLTDSEIKKSEIFK